MVNCKFRKSTILEMLEDDLIKSGVRADHIISMRYTSEDFDWTNWPQAILTVSKSCI